MYKIIFLNDCNQIDDMQGSYTLKMKKSKSKKKNSKESKNFEEHAISFHV